jgi:UDP-3-O-acyl-N-acetylglucosamine deacetylase
LRAPDGRVVTLPEHLLAALLLLDVDDCEIRWEALGPDGAGGAETPILDGSAGDFVRAIRAAGVTGAGRRAPAPLAVSISWGGRAISWSASDGPWPCRARTFIGLPQGRAALGAGLFPGARPGCAVVLGENGASARWGGRPRLPDEPLVHKLLDLLGDLGPWRARGRLSGELHVAAPSHHTNGASIAAAIASGRLRWLA